MTDNATSRIMVNFLDVIQPRSVSRLRATRILNLLGIFNNYFRY